jgi:hypothetical protein
MIRPLFAAAAVAVAASLLVAACNASVTQSCIGGPCSVGTGGSGGAACSDIPRTGDFPCDVFAVVHHECNPCHQSPPLNGAPFPLLTYADTQQQFAPGELISQQMYISVGPSGSPRMPYMSMLSPEDYTTLYGWLAMCAPPVDAGTGCGCPGNGCD